MRGTGERGDPWKKGHWTAEEDKQLMQVVASCGEGQWNKLAKAAGLLRCGKSCRLRWVNYLRPGVKRGQISDAEERLIIQLHGLFGRRWSVIAAHLPGRSDNEIKNYWRSHVRKKVKSNRDYYLYHGGPAMAAALAAVEKEEEEEEETAAATAAEVYAGDGDGDGGENRCVNISHADAIAGTGMNIAPAMKKETAKKMEMDETFHAGDLSEQLAVVTNGGINSVPASSLMASPDQRNGSRCGNIVTHPGKKGGLVPRPASVASEITCLSPRSSSSGSHIAGFGENSERSSGNLSGFGENDRSDSIATIAATSSSSSSSIDNISGFVENGGRRNGNIPGYGENDNVSGNGENGGRISNISGYGEDGYIGGRNGNISGDGENSDISECFRKDGNISGYVENEGTRNGNISDYFGKNGNVSGVGENGGTKYFGKNGNFPEVGGNGGGNVVNISEDFGKNGNVSGNISGVCENGGRDCVNISGFSEINGGRNGNVSDHRVGKNGKGSDSGPASSVVNSKACFYSSPSFSSSSSSSSLSSFSDAAALPPERHSQSLSCLAASEWLPYPDSPLTLSFSWDVQSCLEIASPHYDSDYDPPLPFSDHLWS